MSNNSNKPHYNAPLVAKILREYTLLEALEEGVGKRMLQCIDTVPSEGEVLENNTILMSLFEWYETPEGVSYWGDLDTYLDNKLYQ